MVAIFIYSRIEFVNNANNLDDTIHKVKDFGQFKFALIIDVFISTLLATFASLVDVFIFSKILYKTKFWKLIIISFVIQATLIFLVVSGSFNFLLYFINRITSEIPRDISNSEVMPMAILLAFVVTLAQILIQIDRKLGPGNFWKMITGKFYTPSEEERIFMFVDLRDSTQIAEKIGHLKFSELLRDCFEDFSIVDRYQAEIYQYVGDEVVISWPVKKGLKKQHYLNAFFAFRDVLDAKKTYYQNKYGLVPYFKAGANVGLVVVSEVGIIKREITYHGDTLNTAARIQGECNNQKAQLLISDNLYALTEETSSFSFEDKGILSLKGKENEQRVYKVSPTVDVTNS